jgi:hypothetical protein
MKKDYIKPEIINENEVPRELVYAATEFGYSEPKCSTVIG